MGSLFARFTSLEGGMNSGFDPAVIGDKQFWMGINVISRTGRPQTRPSFNEISPSFQSEEDEAIYRNYRFQGAKEYKPGAASYIVSVHGGWIFVYDVSTTEIYRLSNVPRLSQYVPRCYFCQVVGHMVVQDGTSAPIFINNLNARQSDREDDDVPAGTIMGFGHGRLFLKISKSQFIACDIYKWWENESALKLTEETYLAEGGAFSLPTELGEITGMLFQTHYDTSTGDGPLIVTCENGAQSYAINNSRVIWDDVDLAKMQLKGTGIVGPDALLDVGLDSFFWSWNGLRSWNSLRLQAIFKRKHINQSAELRAVIEDETAWVKPLMSMIQFDNRLLVTGVGEKVLCQTPHHETGSLEWQYDDYAFRCLYVLDFDQMNNVLKSEKATTTQSAAYDGIWTGIHPMKLLSMKINGDERAFAFDKSIDGITRLWELTKKTSGLDSENKMIQSQLYTRAYVGVHPQAYTEEPFSLKRLRSLKVWVGGARQTSPIALLVKNERAQAYTEIQKRQVKARTWQTELIDGEVVVGRTQSVGAVAFSDFEAEYDPNLLQFAASGHELSFGFRWEGFIELSRMMAELSEEGTDSLDFSTDELLLNEDPVDYYNYRL